MPPTTPRRPDKPIFWIVAGPNGSGKSSFYNRTDIEGWGGSVWIINPDLLTAKIAEQEGLVPEAANLAAVQRVERWLDASIGTYQTIGVETVLSSPKYRWLVERAKSRGFEVRMLYIVLNSSELQLRRVQKRVSEGGHEVAEYKVIARRQRSFDQLTWFARQVDYCLIFNNSIGDPKLIAAKEAGGPILQFEAMPFDLEMTLLKAGIDLRAARQ